MLTTPTRPAANVGARPDSRGTAVSVRGLRRRYGGFEAVRDIDLEIERGEIFALLGPNGAGKTTTLEILEGFCKRSGGEVQVLGIDPEHGHRAWRERIGIVLQTSFPEPELTVRECLSLYAGYYAAPRGLDDTLAQVGLTELGARRCERHSGLAQIQVTTRGRDQFQRPRECRAAPPDARGRLPAPDHQR